jgi:hypothetical protein
MFRALTCPSSGGKTVFNTASGIFALCKRLHSTQEFGQETFVMGEPLIGIVAYVRMLSRFSAVLRKGMLLVHLPNFIEYNSSFVKTQDGGGGGGGN